MASEGVDEPRKPAASWVSNRRAGHGAADGEQDLEVLAGGVDDGQAGSVEQLGHRRDVDGEGVDEDDLVVPGELHEGELGEVRALAVELGVERPDLDVAEPVEQVGQGGVVGDDGRFRTAQAGASPVSTGKPASIQASVPPTTFMASTPWARRYSAACMLRAPDRQMIGSGPSAGHLVHPLDELTQWDEDDARDVGLLVLVGVADVEDDLAGVAALRQLVDIDLRDVHQGQGTRGTSPGPATGRRPRAAAGPRDGRRRPGPPPTGR